ncbi:hypothetical protein ABID42_003812 [Arcicella rosea]|uniref:LVIVD repeat-containing protein n=1 Tax=Arcicella rosea TaxID=502909 RepID=UPI00345D811E
MKKTQLLYCILGLIYLQSCQQGANDSVSPFGNGTGGSMARFTLGDGYLYTVGTSNMSIFDIKNTSPQKIKTINLSFGLETIYPYKNMLFIGSNTGMQIFNNQDPANPVLLSTYTHIKSCDPVVVQDNYAYVTLRNGTLCQRGVNSLDIVNISNPSNPTLVKSIPMKNPHGLAVDGKNLFICEGSFGLKSFDLSDPVNPVEKEFLTDVVSYDVIPNQQKLIVTGQNGIYQYDYSDPKALKLLSKIPIE